MSTASARCRALLLLGPTGSGKTPLGNLIEERGLWKLAWVHFDFGDQLRKIAAGEFPAGQFGDEDVATVDRVLVLCPSLTIEEGLLEKFTTLAGNAELSAIMKELGAAVAIPLRSLALLGVTFQVRLRSLP